MKKVNGFAFERAEKRKKKKKRQPQERKIGGGGHDRGKK
jgi:hypothetical protein